jgi:hypothetical protein
MPRNDDAEIGDEVVLWRAIPKRQIETNADGIEAIESWAFRQFPNNELSADVAGETTLEGFTERFPPAHFRTAEFTAGDARACSNIVCRDPDGGGPSHTLICPVPGKSRKRIYEDARKLARRARLLPETG